MRLRTMALVAGALGLLVLAAGLIADANRFEEVAVPVASLETSVVVLGPEVLALAPEGRVAVSGEGPLAATAARPVDAQAWLSSTSATHVTGLVDWDTLRVRTSDRVEPLAPSPAPSPEPTVEATPTPEPTEDATTEDETEGDSTDADAEPLPPRSADHWREAWNGNGRVSVAIADIPAGMPLIVEATDGSTLTDVSMSIERDLNDGWIAPLIWWGVILAAVGLIAALFLIVDLRPVQERTETWLAHRRRGASAAASTAGPGSRRARRATGEGVPVADLGDDAPDESTSTKEDRS